MEDELYRENILEHYKHPRNFGTLDPCTIHHKENNPICGDAIELFLIIEKNKVKEVKFSGQGCAISMASASLLTEKIKGMSIEEIKKFNQKDILAMLGISLDTLRIKCALLSLKTLNRSLELWKN